MPGVTAVTQVRGDQALIGGEETEVTGIDAGTIGHFYRFAWSDGSDETLAGLGRDGALVTKTYAEDHGLAVGEQLALQSPSGEERTFTVRGLYDPSDLNRCSAPSASRRRRSTTRSRSAATRSRSSTPSRMRLRGLEEAAAGFGDAELFTGAEYGKAATQDFQTILSMLYVLLAFSVIVSLFGMVNTLVLSVYERTRELGMMRAIGMTRRQARRMIRHESVITALIGAALGLPLGIFLAALVTQALSQYDVSMVLPVPMLAAFTLVAVLAGVAAAILPARRASRLNVLDALHYE